MHTESGHAKLSLAISEAVARCWLIEGAGDQQAAKVEVSQACYRWLSRHSRGLSQDSLREIVREAMVAAYAVFHEKQLSTREALIELQKRLNTLRARDDRLRGRQVVLEKRFTEREDPQDLFEEIVNRDFWRAMARLIERHMTAALFCLSLNDQAILRANYELDGIIEPPIDLPTLDFPSAEAEKKALFRARQRFNSHLESLIESELAVVSRFDRPLYEAALRLVRGGKPGKALAAMGHGHKTRSREH